MEPTAPDLSLMIPGKPALTTLVEPAGLMRVSNGDMFRVRVTMPSNAPAFVDDIVPVALHCGSADYVSWYYVHAKLPPP